MVFRSERCIDPETDKIGDADHDHRYYKVFPDDIHRLCILFQCDKVAENSKKNETDNNADDHCSGQRNKEDRYDENNCEHEF